MGDRGGRKIRKKCGGGKKEEQKISSWNKQISKIKLLKNNSEITKTPKEAVTLDGRLLEVAHHDVGPHVTVEVL